MKATGIVRTVDDLGRVVLPKELRRVMAIKDGDPVEFYVDNDSIVIKKFDVAGDIEQILSNFEKTIKMKSDLFTPEQNRALLDMVEDMKDVLYKK
jgi:transcriptional pleiotropic regulator of transition state genes